MKIVRRCAHGPDHSLLDSVQPKCKDSRLFTNSFVHSYSSYSSAFSAICYEPPGLDRIPLRQRVSRVRSKVLVISIDMLGRLF